MSFRCGIVGLPNVGKSTLFNALTNSNKAQAENFPFCTIDPNIGIVSVPDERLNKISKISKSAKTINAGITFVDIAGLVKGASKGEGLGKKIHFPTANIDKNDDGKLIPGNGVYCVRITLEGQVFTGMCNIGFRPTVSKSKDISIEVHLFDFDLNIYGKSIRIYFIHFIREEKYFENLDLLKKQLKLDKNKCLEYSINNV